MKFLSERGARFRLAWLLLGGMACTPRLGAQSVVTEDVAGVNRIIDSAARRDSLPCQVWRTESPPRSPWSPPRPLSYPELDFFFRYTVGFSISCTLGEIQPGGQLHAYIRVKPRNGDPVLLAEEFDVPELPPEKFTRYYSAPLNAIVISMSGGFAVGVGRYSADFVLTDRQGRTIHKHWTVKAGSQKEERKYPLALKPNAVAPLLDYPWDGKLDPNGLRVTVLLHAVPIDPQGALLHALDRDDLLQSLAALLRKMPCRLVRLVAFNLDEQSEVFRSESFDRQEFTNLSKALEKLETATVPWEALERSSWQKQLAQLARQELLTSAPPDAVIFFGPRTHFDGDLPVDALSSLRDAHVPVFYFKFFGRVDRADGIERLTKSMRGSTFVIYEPNDLAHGIQKMLAQIHPNRKDAATQPQK